MLSRLLLNYLDQRFAVSNPEPYWLYHRYNLYGKPKTGKTPARHYSSCGIPLLIRACQTTSTHGGKAPCKLRDATLLANNFQHCWMLHVASVCTPGFMLLRVVVQSLKPVKRLATCKRKQQLPTLSFCLSRLYYCNSNNYRKEEMCGPNDIRSSNNFAF